MPDRNTTSRRPPAKAAATPRRRGIGSVETGLRVLSALAGAGAPAPLGEVARLAGLSASQAHRYLASLIAAGFARQRSEGALYDLDSGALRLGLAALARLDALGRTEQEVAALVQRGGRTALIAVWGDAGATVVRWHPGNPAVLTTLGLGSVLPLLRSATGQVFLAFGDRPFMDEVARRALVADRAGAPVRPDALIRAVRQAGMARVDGALIPGLRAMAAPVFDPQGRLVLVATSIATAAFDPGGDDAAAAALRDACEAATAAIGGHPPPAAAN